MSPLGVHGNSPLGGAFRSPLGAFSLPSATGLPLNWVRVINGDLYVAGPLGRWGERSTSDGSTVWAPVAADISSYHLSLSQSTETTSIQSSESGHVLFDGGMFSRRESDGALVADGQRSRFVPATKPGAGTLRYPTINLTGPKIDAILAAPDASTMNDPGGDLLSTHGSTVASLTWQDYADNDHSINSALTNLGLRPSNYTTPRAFSGSLHAITAWRDADNPYDTIYAASSSSTRDHVFQNAEIADDPGFLLPGWSGRLPGGRLYLAEPCFLRAEGSGNGATVYTSDEFAAYLLYDAGSVSTADVAPDIKRVTSTLGAMNDHKAGITRDEFVIARDNGLEVYDDDAVVLASVSGANYISVSQIDNSGNLCACTSSRLSKFTRSGSSLVESWGVNAAPGSQYTAVDTDGTDAYATTTGGAMRGLIKYRGSDGAVLWASN